MDRQNALRIIEIGAARDAREWRYKADYPRRIDQYIDFFGTGDTLRASTLDLHSEVDGSWLVGVGGLEFVEG